VQPEAAGSAITLETSEPLFYLSAALNACGYDTGLAESSLDVTPAPGSDWTGQ